MRKPWQKRASLLDSDSSRSEWSEELIPNVNQNTIVKNILLSLVSALTVFGADTARAGFIVHLSHTDFGLTNTFNQITEFSFDISFSGDLVAGGVYNNPAINTADYRVRGVLPDTTPSGFDSFLLIRSMNGAEFYGLSPESGINFSIAPTANLSDGVQISELMGSDPVFSFNAREFNQDPGRYHPPIITLNSDGTGLLTNANNKSTFSNPPPPMGSGLPVDVAIGDEYTIDLTFSSSLTIASVPEPSSGLLFSIVLGVLAWNRRRK